MSFLVNILENLDKQAASALKTGEQGGKGPVGSTSVPDLPTASSKDFFDDGEAPSPLPSSLSTQALPGARSKKDDADDLGALFSYLNSVADVPPPAPSPSASPPTVTASPQATTTTDAAMVKSESADDSRMKVKLLESKVQSLQNEIATLTGHVRHFGAALDKAKDDLKKQRQVIDEREREVKQLRDSEAQFDGVLREKDQRIADMEVELEEARQDSLGEREEVQRWRSRCDGLADEKAAAEQLAARLGGELEALQAQRRQSAHELEARLTDVNEALVEAQRTAQHKDTALAEALQQRDDAAARLAAAQTELKEYQQRASAVLESKDRLVEQLQQQLATAAAAAAAGDHSDGVADARSEALAQQVALLRSERDGLLAQLAAADSAADEAQQQAKTDRLLHASELAAVQERLAAAEKECQELQLALAQRSADSAEARAGYDKEVQRLQQQIEAQAVEQQLLQRQLKAKSLGASSAELEARNQQLAELLVKQQRQVETLRTQNAALQVQLEQVAGAAPASSSTAATAVAERDDDIADTVGHALPLRRRPQAQPKLRSLASLAPELSGRSDTVSQALIKTAERIDAVSSFTISVLQEYPLSRAMLFVYLVLLHLWSVFLLQHMMSPHQSLPS